MPKFRKKPVPVRIEPVPETRTVKTMEGSQQVEPGQYLATGVGGEQYAFGPEALARIPTFRIQSKAGFAAYLHAHRDRETAPTTTGQ